MKWKNWLVAIIGAWLIITPWIYGFSSHSGADWTSVIAGAITLVLGIWAASLPKSTATWANWENWTTFAMGIWFIIQPWSVGIASFAGNTWNDVILGIVIAILDLWVMGQNINTNTSNRSHSRQQHATS